jgi:protein-S-isoprenylcysteine O-methyltransferase Ste14
MITNIDMTIQEKKILLKKLILRFSLLPIFFLLLVILPAWTIDFWQAYVVIAILVVPMFFVLMYFLKKDPRFLERRIRMKEKEKQQKLIVAVTTPLFLACFFIPGLDHRYGWSNVPLNIVVLSDILIFSGYFFIFFVFKQNSYASRVVEINENQKVISNGLYRFVRHPMYLGVIIMYIPIPIALGSYWGLIAVTGVPIALIFRIINEEKVLSDQLPGYNDYCQKTKYRLIPFVW